MLLTELFEYKFLSGKQSDQSMLPKWIKVSKKRFDVIKNKVQNAKKKKKKNCKLGQIVVALLLLTNQTNYFKT